VYFRMPDYLLAYLLYVLHKEYGIQRVPLKVVKELFDEEDISIVEDLGHAKIRKYPDGRYLKINLKKEDEFKQLEEVLKNSPLFAWQAKYIEQVAAELVEKGLLKPSKRTDESETADVHT